MSESLTDHTAAESTGPRRGAGRVFQLSLLGSVLAGVGAYLAWLSIEWRMEPLLSNAVLGPGEDQATFEAALNHEAVIIYASGTLVSWALGALAAVLLVVAVISGVRILLSPRAHPEQPATRGSGTTGRPAGTGSVLEWLRPRASGNRAERAAVDPRTRALRLVNAVVALLMLAYVVLLVASGFIPGLREHQEPLLVHIVPAMMIIIAAGYVVRSWVRAGSAFIPTGGPVATPPIVEALASPPAPERTDEQVAADAAQWRKTLLTLLLVVSCAAVLTAVAGALIT